MIRKLRSLRRDERGATIIEFAMIAPVMLMLIMGLCEVLYEYYVQTTLTGAVQKAARDAGIEGGGDAAVTAVIDSKVAAAIEPLVKGVTQNCGTNPAAGTWCAKRKSYDNFDEVRPERFTDTNGNHSYDVGECFTDTNGNRTWDADPGVSGQGGADDVALYTVSLTYGRLFPVAAMLGIGEKKTISATTMLKNQPYTGQTTSTDERLGGCT